jgi:hypothetical protein
MRARGRGCTPAGSGLPEFADDGVITGKAPKTVDGSDLDAALIVIADGLNDPDTTPKEQQ